MSEDIRAYAGAFASAKKSFKATGKSGKTTQYKGGYANLDDIYNAVELALLDNNIIIKHAVEVYIEPNNKFEVLVTRLIHYPTGQWAEDKRFLESEKPGNQGRGAAQTYSRKYAVLTICGIAPSEDDDGYEEQKHIEVRDSEKISEQQLTQLKDLTKQASNPSELYKKILGFTKISSYEFLPAYKFNMIKKYIEDNK